MDRTWTLLEGGWRLGVEVTLSLSRQRLIYIFLHRIVLHSVFCGRKAASASFGLLSQAVLWEILV